MHLATRVCRRQIAWRRKRLSLRPPLVFATLAAMSSARGRDITQAVFGNLSGPLPRCYAFGIDDVIAATCLRHAVVVLPGGSYNHHAPHEGEAVAQRLAETGIAVFVLPYSLGPTPLASHVLMQPGRVIAYIRNQARLLGVDPDRVSILGFSAGGHLAGLSSCHSLRVGPQEAVPCAVGLVYPVVSFEQDVHTRSMAAWLGPDDTPEARAQASLERQITAAFPRVFVVSASDDAKVLPSHTLALTQACLAHKVSIETHLLPIGGHGFGLGLVESGNMWDWCARYVTWLTS